MLIIVFLFLNASFVWAQLSPKKLIAFEKFVQNQMKADKATGMTIGFIKNGKIWVKGYGYADLENKVLAKAESAYRLASITKPMTATAIMQLVEQGKINLNAEVQKYVPYFPKKKYPVTVGQLLGHLGGISHYKNYDREGHFKDHKNTREAIRVFEKFNLIAKPGTRFRYTSYGFNLLGAVIEGASGKPYGEYMRENIWKPLGMNATRLDDPNAIIPNRVKGYRLINGRVGNSEFVDISSRFSSGGVRSTVVDILKFADGISKGKLLTKKSHDTMWTPMITNGGFYTNYGRGWNTYPVTGHFMIYHSGSQAETKTILYVFPKQKLAIAAALNFENVDPRIYARKLYELISGETWATQIYAKNENDAMPLQVIREMFLFGMSYFERFEKPIHHKTKDLKKAFAFFNDSINKADQSTSRNLRNGINPRGNLVLVKISSFMAAKLRENSSDEDFNNIFKGGTFAFFKSYIDLYKKNPSHPPELRFNPTFEKRVAKWNREWNQSWNDYTKNLRLSTSSDIKIIGARLKKQFSRATIYPDYIGTLDSMIPNLAKQGDFAKAFEVAQVNYDLYPESSTTTATLGVLHVIAGNNKKGHQFLSKSKEINPRGGASAFNLISVAKDVASIGQTKAGVSILKIGVNLYPNNANLYHNLGELYLKLKQKEKAIESYSKALKINPNYFGSAKATKIINRSQK